MQCSKFWDIDSQKKDDNHLPVKEPILDDHEQVKDQVEVVEAAGEVVEAAPHHRLDILSQLQGPIHGKMSHNNRVLQG